MDLRTEVCTNASKHFKNKNPKLAAAIPDDFPNRTVLNCYLHPIIHTGDRVIQPNLSFSVDDPRADSLARFADLNFDWGKSIVAVVEHFTDGIFTAIALRHLLRAAVTMDHGSTCLPHLRCPIIVKMFPKHAREANETCFLREVRVLLVLPARLVKQICASAYGAPFSANVMAEVEKKCARCRAWVPEAILRHVRPDFFDSPNHSSKGKEKGNFFSSSLLLYASADDFTFLEVVVVSSHSKSGNTRGMYLSPSLALTVLTVVKGTGANAEASTSQVAGPSGTKRGRVIRRRTKVYKVTGSEGQSIYELTSEDYSTSDSA